MSALGTVVVAVALGMGGCGSSSRSSSAATSGQTLLRVDLVSAVSVARTYTVRCDPAGGNAPAPAAVCAAIREQPRLLRAVRGLEHSCPGGTPVVFVTGFYHGRPVEASFSACSSGQESLSARWLGLLRYSGRESVVCSAPTLRLIASRPAISRVERGLVEQALQGIPRLVSQGVHCHTAARSRSRVTSSQRRAPMLQLGSHGPAVRALQSELARLTYLPRSAIDGGFGTRTWHAVVAFQGWSGLAMDGVVGPQTRKALVHARLPTPWSTADGFEVHIAQQVLLLVRAGRVQRAIHVSTGMPGWPTPRGHFTILERDPMSWSLRFHAWMPLAEYFYDGYALHEFPEVPAYPASHGCIRVPSDEAQVVWQFGRIGMRLWTTP
jgi:hypothetical protein